MNKIMLLNLLSIASTMGAKFVQIQTKKAIQKHYEEHRQKEIEALVEQRVNERLNHYE